MAITPPPRVADPHPPPAFPPGAEPGTALPMAPEKCDSPMCFNENFCCNFWSQKGECEKNPTWMLCNCKVSCGKCFPQYLFGSCVDYHTGCPKWASTGECQKNEDWMKDNCRKSCNSCYDMTQLQKLCPLS
uniref:ShKT domain-containing protein n=1 Tax=Acrobeloides nanus TaxID=290746 RepID=A0A914E472_9BILA